FKLGVNLGELWQLSPLARWLREHKRYRFLLTAPPLRLPGAVGSPATPVAPVRQTRRRGPPKRGGAGGGRPVPRAGRRRPGSRASGCARAGPQTSGEGACPPPAGSFSASSS